MLRLRTLLSHFCKGNRPKRTTPTPNRTSIPTPDPIPEVHGISRKHAILYVPSIVTTLCIATLESPSQMTLMSYLTATTLVPSIACNILFLKYPFVDPKYTRFYKVWSLVSGFGLVGICLVMPVNPVIQNGCMLVINLVSGLIEYYLRMEGLDQTSEIVTYESRVQVASLSVLTIRMFPILMQIVIIYLYLLAIMNHRERQKQALINSSNPVTSSPWSNPPSE